MLDDIGAIGCGYVGYDRNCIEYVFLFLKKVLR